MTKPEEQAFARGERAAWARVLGQCIRELSGSASDAPLVDAARAAKLEHDLTESMRMLCTEHGVEFPEGAHLVDVLEKHLVPALLRARPNSGTTITTPSRHR